MMAGTASGASMRGCSVKPKGWFGGAGASTSSVSTGNWWPKTRTVSMSAAAGAAGSASSVVPSSIFDGLFRAVSRVLDVGKSLTNPSGKGASGTNGGGGTPNAAPRRNSLGGQKKEPAKHLVIMVNGLWGSAPNWAYFKKLMTQAGKGQIEVHASEASSYHLTHDGVDVCGERLANEVRALVAHRPYLERISFVGHSLGGLLCRYAVSLLYDPATGKLAGLKPAQFITLATPHLGCDGQGSVPFLGAVGPLRVPVEGLARVLAPMLIGRTGSHLFLRDGDGPGGLPLLQAMTRDSPPGTGPPFITALTSFPSLHLYANTSHDFMVSWSTSAIRKSTDVPPAYSASPNRRGPPSHIVLDVPARARASPGMGGVLGSALASFTTSVKCGDLRGAVTGAARSVVASAAAAVGVSGLGGPLGSLATLEGAHPPPTTPPVEDFRAGPLRLPAPREALVEEMRRRLDALAWRRVDVSFEGEGMLGHLAHMNIQVTREWMNAVGGTVVGYVTENFLAEDRAMVAAAEALPSPKRAAPPWETIRSLSIPLPDWPAVKKAATTAAATVGKKLTASPADRESKELHEGAVVH